MITRHRSSVLCIADANLLAIELEDPVTKQRFWSLPGGAIEAGESAEAAAVREVREETGYNVRLDLNSRITTQYRFHWGGKDYDCHTTWFAATTSDTSPQPVDDADFLIRHAWLACKDKNQLFGSHPAILDAVTLLLRHYNSNGSHVV